MRARPALAFLCVRLALAADNYIGAAACGVCHPRQLTGQSASGHAVALRTSAQHPLADKFPSAPIMLFPKLRFQMLRDTTGLTVRADDGRHVMQLPVEWAFGAGAQAVTFVTKVGAQHYLEHSLTYFRDTESLDLTPRHERLAHGTLQQAMGQPLKTDGITRCFKCHSTGPVSIQTDGSVRISEPGVRCESCHGPGSAHRDFAAAGLFKQTRQAIRNPKHLSASNLNQFCGGCHRALTADFDWDSSWNVRHQPPFFSRSVCFQKSGGKLSCLTCHDLHQPLRHDGAFYGSKCVACHQNRNVEHVKACRPADISGCIGCHMPPVTASAHLRFSNHWIGVYQAGDLLKPNANNAHQ